MNNDLISREALKEAIAEFHQKENDRLHSPLWGSIGLNALNRLIDNVPTVEVTKPQSYVMGFCDGLKAQTYEKPPMFERTQGEWGKWVISEIQCPICLEYFQTDCYSTEELKKCPSCGADLRGGDK